jgi:hypothetical protein
MVSPGSPLIGEPGQITQLSPDGRLSVCRGLITTFPAEAIVNFTDKYMTISTTALPGASHQITHSAGSELRNHLHYNYPLGLHVGDALSTPSFEMQKLLFDYSRQWSELQDWDESCEAVVEAAIGGLL